MEKTLTYLFKILVVLGFVFLALMFIVPIVCGIVNPDGEIGVTLGKVFLILFLIDGSFLAILMPVGYCLLIKTKIDKHPITSSNVDDLLSSLREKLHTGGYLFVKEGNSKYGPIWIYKKSRTIHDDYFIVIDSSNISACDEITDLREDFGIGDFYYGIFLFCCDGLKKKNVTIILTTHDMKDIESLAKRLIIIGKGKKLYDGDIKDIKEKYTKNKIVEIFFSDLKTLPNIKNTKIVSKEKDVVRILIDTKKISVSSITLEYSKVCEIKDVNIIEKGIDDIIYDLYQDLEL